MRISAAQTRPIKGNIIANIETHKKLIHLAVANKADIIIFPELSLTGYEPELAKELATTQDDKRFDDFQDLSNKYNITIGTGMPTNTNKGILISMIIFQPNVARQTYSKQQLHADELPYFTNGEQQTILSVANNKVAPAICYESLQMNHADSAVKLGAEFYLASVAKSQGGIDKAMLHYPAVAATFSIPVLMSNCVGYCDNFESVGQSAVWTKQGNIVGQLKNNAEAVLVFDTETEEVIEQAL